MRALYVVCEVKGNAEEQFHEILDGFAAGDWWTSVIAAQATMDQWNAYHMSKLSDEDYFAGNFATLGTFKFELQGLVTSYEV